MSRGEQKNSIQTCISHFNQKKSPRGNVCQSPSVFLTFFWNCTCCQTGTCSNSFITGDFSQCCSCNVKKCEGKTKFPLCFSLQQNTSSLWSINEPFYIHLLQGSRVNADEGMKVGAVLCGFSPFFRCSMKCDIHLFTNISISVVRRGLTM